MWQKQQETDLKSIATAIDVDLARINESKNFAPYYGFYKYDNFPDPNVKMIVSPVPFYDSTKDLYMTFNHDISRFNYTISSNVYEFYNNLFNAEKDREFIIQNKNTTDPYTQAVVGGYYKEMKYLIVECGNKLPTIRGQLKEYLR